jgi:DNA-directed RNA polymerase specialized sigma24 family protein
MEGTVSRGGPGGGEEHEMVDRLVFQGCSADTESAVRSSWSRRREDVERLLRGTPPQRHLRLTARGLPNQLQVRIVLLLPTVTLIAGSRGSDAADTVGDAVTGLCRSIAGHLRAMRQERLRVRRKRGAEELAAAGDALDERAQERRDAGFFEELRPFLRSLRHHAHRELVLAQLQGDVPEEDLTVSELLDEVLVRAHARLEGRECGRSWESSLIELVHEVLDERVGRRSLEVSIEAPIPADDPRYGADFGWIAENEPFWGPAEPLTLDDVLPDSDSRGPVEDLTESEQRTWILIHLRGMPQDQRRAFALHVLEGWSEDQIATLQDRSPSDVRADIDETRRSLVSKLGAARSVHGKSVPTR